MAASALVCRLSVCHCPLVVGGDVRYGNDPVFDSHAGSDFQEKTLGIASHVVLYAFGGRDDGPSWDFQLEGHRHFLQFHFTPVDLHHRSQYPSDRTIQRNPREVSPEQ